MRADVADRHEEIRQHEGALNWPLSVDLGQVEDLARIDQVRIADLILICAVDQGVLEAGTLVRPRNVPETVATHDNQAFAVARSRRHGNALPHCCRGRR
jgi:hypothetical protein